MEVFVVVIGIVYVFLLAAVIALHAAEAKLREKRAETPAPPEQAYADTVLREDSVLLRVEGGNVVILRREAAPPQPAAPPAPEPPVVEPYDELAVAEAEGKPDEKLDEKLDEKQIGVWESLIERYGAVSENSRVIEVAPADTRTFGEKLADMPADTQARYAALKEYVLAKGNGAAASESRSHELFKYRSQRLMRAVVRRDSIVLMVMLPNADLNRFIREEGIKSVRMSPVSLHLDSDEDLAIAKQTADIAASNIDADFEYRRERKRQQRRERIARLRAEKAQKSGQ